MKIYENIEHERNRIEKCISKFGWTSDHNLDWFIDSVIDNTGKPVFVEFEDGSGLLVHKYPDQCQVWSDPLSRSEDAVQRILEFSEFTLKTGVKEIWCVDVSDKIYPELRKFNSVKVNDIYYSMSWPVLNIVNFDLSLPGGHFKEMRNAKSKFYREHQVEIVDARSLSKDSLVKIVGDWFNVVTQKNKEDIYDLRYRNAVENGFRGFSTARAMVVDGEPVGVNAGYEVPNHTKRFAGVIGIHNYSQKDLGTVLYLEDFEWIKNAGYKELDMQGVEYDWELKTKTQYGAIIERKTNTFSIQ